MTSIPKDHILTISDWTEVNSFDDTNLRKSDIEPPHTQHNTHVDLLHHDSWQYECVHSWFQAYGCILSAVKFVKHTIKRMYHIIIE